MIAVSSAYYYITLYLLYLRNKLKLLTKQDLEVSLFSTSFGQYRKVYIMPSLEEISEFNINIITIVNSNELNKEREYTLEFLEYIETVDDPESIKEFIKSDTEGYFKFYLYEFYLIEFPKYFLLFDQVFKTVLINDYTLIPSIKYFIAIMVR